MDDDLVTPISDNEYVLKGCDVRRTPPPCADGPKGSPLDEKKLNRKGSWEQKLVEEALQVQVTRDYDKSSPKPPPPIDQDSPGAEGNPAPFRIVLPQDLQQRKQRKQRRQREAAATEKQTQAVVVASRPAAAVAPGGGERHKQQRPAVGNRERRMRVSQVLHSILTCGAAADAVDDAVVPRRSAGAIDDGEDGDGWQQRTPVCPGMDGCGIHMSRKVKLHQRGGKDGSKAKREGGRRDRVAAAHKPATLPRCSQCGKQFKPQELHLHMQSCRGLRERMRSSAAASAQFSVDRSRSSAAKANHSSTERPHAAVFLLTES
uniref:Uncharacterized protein n=4 Tax=Avena sativa TaxID=4498 RepID=A0ACD5WHH1_AVESA